MLVFYMGFRINTIKKVIKISSSFVNHTIFTNSAGYFNKLMSETSAEYITSIMAENTAVFINRKNLHKYLLQNFLNKQNEGLYIEFGVASGATINMFANKLPKKTIHGFDAFFGLRDVWSKPELGSGSMNLEGRPPQSRIECCSAHWLGGRHS